MVKQHKFFNKFLIYPAIYLIFLVAADPAYAKNDLQTILHNLRTIIYPLTTLLLIVSYVAGIFMVMRAVFLFKTFGSSPQSTKPGDFTGPLVYLIIGSVLLYLPSTTDLITKTIFGTDAGSVIDGNAINFKALGTASSSVLGYVSSTVAIEGQWADLFDTIIYYVQFIGFLAFIRGWFILSHIGQSGAQPGNVSKGLVHIVGGIIAVNFLPMVDAVRMTVFGS